jgi:ankyrin repeat protein
VGLIDSPEQLCYRALGLTSPYVDYRESVISAKGKRVEGTCEWILGHTDYHAWLNGAVSQLWISGGPGKGKTMMSIFLTEHLERKISTMENTHLVHYFFSFQDENRNTGVTLLQSLIHQIVTKRPHLKTHLLPYIKPGNSQQPQLPLEPLWAIFKKLIQDPKLGTILCVLDGLDESDKDTTQILLPRLIDLVSSISLPPLSTTFKLIVVSRDISGLKDCTRIKLDPDNNESVHGDIEKFISIRVRDLSKIVGSRHECEREVQATLLERAEGTFLWVGFATYELMQKRTWAEVFDALKTLPSGLPAIYSRMLHQIPARHRKISSKILQWVTMAFRPLTLLEIALAIGLKSPSSSISLKHAIRDEVVLCGSFLKVQYSEVTLIHQSVREYLLDEKQHNSPVLEAFRIKPNEAHFEMAQTCFQFIKQSSLQQSSLIPYELQSREQLFLRYAAQHWLEHSASCSDLTAELFDSTQSFFTHNRRLRDNWWIAYGRVFFYWYENYETPPLLYLACDLKIFPWVEMIIQEIRSTGSEYDKVLLRSFLDQRDSIGRTALHYAASAGNYPLVHLLVQSGADISAEAWGKKVLRSAAIFRKDNGQIVQFLLDQGAEIDLPDTDGETALHKAVETENLQVVRTLLDRGASLGWVGSDGSKALHIATSHGDVEIVKLLLDRGATLGQVNPWGETALHIATRDGHVDTVQLLLDRGANPEAVDLEGSTALHIAAAKEDMNKVQLLLDRGASLEHENPWGETALHIAARSGNVDTVQLLLNRGGNLERVDCEGSTALHIAVWSEKIGTVQLLLEKGADMQAKTHRGETVLHSATFHPFLQGSQSGMSDIVQLLLDRGADVNARNNRGKTAFDITEYIEFLESLDAAAEESEEN